MIESAFLVKHGRPQKVFFIYFLGDSGATAPDQGAATPDHGAASAGTSFEAERVEASDDDFSHSG